MLGEAEAGTSLLSDAEIEREASNLIVAGSDTTAVTLTYLIWAVLKHPSIKQKLQEKVDALSPGFSRKEANALPYLGMVVKETLRLYGAAPGSLPRTVPQGGRNLGDISCRKEQQLARKHLLYIATRQSFRNNASSDQRGGYNQHRR
jgi:hypothetical protein